METRSPRKASRTVSAVRPRRTPRAPVHDQRRRALHGFIPKRPCASSPACRPVRRTVPRAAEGVAGREVSTTMAFTSLLRDLLRFIRSSVVGSCRSCPMRPAPSGWIPCFASSRSTHRAAAVRTGRPRPAAVLHRGARWPVARGGHHRGRFDGVLDRRRHQPRKHRCADGALLHLLFDARRSIGDLARLAADARTCGF